MALYVRQAKKNSNSETRIPITTVFEAIFAFISAIVFILMGLGIANSKNGLGPALWLLVSLPFSIAYFFSCLKMIHLGDRVIPKPIRKEIQEQETKFNTNQNKNDGKDLSLIRRDPLLVFFFFIAITSQFSAILFPVFLGTIINPGSSDFYTILGSIFQGVMHMFAAAVILRQTYRVIRYIKIFQSQQEKVFGENENAMKHGGNDNKLERIVKNLKIRALLTIIGGSIGIMSYFLILVTPISWKILATCYFASVIGPLGGTILYKPPSMKVCCCCYADNTSIEKVSAKSSNPKSGKIAQPVVTEIRSSKKDLLNLPT